MNFNTSELVYWKSSAITHKKRIGTSKIFVCLLVVRFLQSRMYHETEMMQKAYYKIEHSNIVIIIHIEDIEEMDHTRALSAETPEVLPSKKGLIWCLLYYFCQIASLKTRH